MRTEAKFRLMEPKPELHRLKVIGVGGGGGNAVRYMNEHGLEGVDLIVANTDMQALSAVGSGIKRLQIGESTTRGLGAGAQWDVGEKSAQESRAAIAALLGDSDMVFITAGMGGGTGTGAAPVVAEVARELGALTVAVITTPFRCEQPARMAVAEKGIARLRDQVDGLIVVPNQKLMDMHGELRMPDLFREGTLVLHNAVCSIADLILHTGLMNIDFGDVRTVLSMPGTMALMGTGIASGSSRAEQAVNEAINCPLLEDIDVCDAAGLLVNISGDCYGHELETIRKIAHSVAASGAIVKCGHGADSSLGEALKVTVIATGVNMAASGAAAAKAPQTRDLYDLPVRADAPVAQAAVPRRRG